MLKMDSSFICVGLLVCFCGHVIAQTDSNALLPGATQGNADGPLDNSWIDFWTKLSEFMRTHQLPNINESPVSGDESFHGTSLTEDGTTTVSGSESENGYPIANMTDDTGDIGDVYTQIVSSIANVDDTAPGGTVTDSDSVHDAVNDHSDTTSVSPTDGGSDDVGTLVESVSESFHHPVPSLADILIARLRNRQQQAKNAVTKNLGESALDFGRNEPQYNAPGTSTDKVVDVSELETVTHSNRDVTQAAFWTDGVGPSFIPAETADDYTESLPPPSAPVMNEAMDEHVALPGLVSTVKASRPAVKVDDVASSSEEFPNSDFYKDFDSSQDEFYGFYPDSPHSEEENKILKPSNSTVNCGWMGRSGETPFTRMIDRICRTLKPLPLVFHIMILLALGVISVVICLLGYKCMCSRKKKQEETDGGKDSGSERGTKKEKKTLLEV